MNPLLQRMGLLLLPEIRSRTRSVSGDLMTDLVDKVHHPYCIQSGTNRLANLEDL